MHRIFDGSNLDLAVYGPELPPEFLDIFDLEYERQGVVATMGLYEVRKG